MLLQQLNGRLETLKKDIEVAKQNVNICLDALAASISSQNDPSSDIVEKGRQIEQYIDALNRDLLKGQSQKTRREESRWKSLTQTRSKLHEEVHLMTLMSQVESVLHKGQSAMQRQDVTTASACLKDGERIWREIGENAARNSPSIRIYYNSLKSKQDHFETALTEWMMDEIEKGIVLKHELGIEIGFDLSKFMSAAMSMNLAETAINRILHRVEQTIIKPMAASNNSYTLQTGSVTWNAVAAGDGSVTNFLRVLHSLLTFLVNAIGTSREVREEFGTQVFDMIESWISEAFRNRAEGVDTSIQAGKDFVSWAESLGWSQPWSTVVCQPLLDQPWQTAKVKLLKVFDSIAAGGTQAHATIPPSPEFEKIVATGFTSRPDVRDAWLSSRSDFIDTFCGSLNDDKYYRLRPKVSGPSGLTDLIASIHHFVTVTASLSSFDDSIWAQSDTLIESTVSAYLSLTEPALKSNFDGDSFTLENLVELLASACGLGCILLFADACRAACRAPADHTEHIADQLRELQASVNMATDALMDRHKANFQLPSFIIALSTPNQFEEAESEIALEAMTLKKVFTALLHNLPDGVAENLGVYFIEDFSQAAMQETWHAIEKLNTVMKKKVSSNSTFMGVSVADKFIYRAKQSNLLGQLSAAVQETGMAISGGGSWGTMFDHAKLVGVTPQRRIRKVPEENAAAETLAGRKDLPQLLISLLEQISQHMDSLLILINGQMLVQDVKVMLSCLTEKGEVTITGNEGTPLWSPYQLNQLNQFKETANKNHSQSMMKRD